MLIYSSILFVPAIGSKRSDSLPIMVEIPGLVHLASGKLGLQETWRRRVRNWEVTECSLNALTYKDKANHEYDK